MPQNFVPVIQNIFETTQKSDKSTGSYCSVFQSTYATAFPNSKVKAKLDNIFILKLKHSFA